eukprot:TRINITY_DN66469_c9_g1_i1.p1 TRINITY_DN66469_c9_g1~~TRINITY_DN66469_c9_g1_i1.p1  ORF type:complete len:598 (-),score=327.84 TRINITY_DN66469_c9_g1_i1:51-1844(-)
MMMMMMMTMTMLAADAVGLTGSIVWTLVYALCVIVAVVVVAGIKWVVVEPKRVLEHYKKQGVPGYEWQWMGQAKLIEQYDEAGRVKEFYHDAVKRFGHTFTYQQGPLVLLHISDPPLVREVLRTHKLDYHKSSQLMKLSLRPLLGDGLLMSEGRFWKRQRKALAPTFHFHNLRSMVALIDDVCAQHMQAWRDEMKALADAGKQQRMEVSHKISKLTMDIIAVAAFGPTFLSDPQVNAAVRHAFGEVLNELQVRGLSGVSIMPIVRDLPTASYRKVHDGCAAIEREIRKVIDERRRGLNRPALGGTDLLDLLLEAAESEKMSERAILDEAITFVFAAFETTSNMLAWLFAHTIKRPDVWRRCATEVREMLDDVRGRARSAEGDDVDMHPLSLHVEYADFKKLRVVEATILETLRLAPPAPLVNKYALREHKIGDIVVPKGGMILINMLELHRHPDYWVDPERFDVDRFLNGTARLAPTDVDASFNKSGRGGGSGDNDDDSDHDDDGGGGGKKKEKGANGSGKKAKKPWDAFQYIPFSGGLRSCLGKNFAMLKSKVIISHIMTNFEFAPIPGADPIPTFQRLNFVPKTGLDVAVTTLKR